jgi:cyclopropane-fatty-acyl-phospholipid synthase
MRIFERLFRRLIRSHHLIVIGCRGSRHEFGEVSQNPIIVRLHDRATARAVLLNPQLALGEAYMNGRLTIEQGDIGELLSALTSNLGHGFGGGHWEWINAARLWMRWLMPANGLSRSKDNVLHHYDLSAGLYDLFLDSDKQYSCAYFDDRNTTLETAQANKCRRIAAKLALAPNQRVLDIGSGWGGLGLHIASSEHVDVTGVTLSEEQFKVAVERAQRQGLSDRVRFKLEDYRQVAGPFERIVSVGMLEHVGVSYYQQYFDRIAELLTDDGVAVVHAIGRSDGPGVTNPWIAKYIFPGGYTPALSEVLPAIEHAGLIVTDIEIMRLHYAKTLAEWRKRFVANWDRAARLYDERFCRMWEFYLAGAEMAFRNQGLMVFQIQLAKRIDTLPLARDYMMPEPAEAAKFRSVA